MNKIELNFYILSFDSSAVSLKVNALYMLTLCDVQTFRRNVLPLASGYNNCVQYWTDMTLSTDMPI